MENCHFCLEQMMSTGSIALGEVGVPLQGHIMSKDHMMIGIIHLYDRVMMIEDDQTLCHQGIDLKYFQNSI